MKLRLLPLLLAPLSPHLGDAGNSVSEEMTSSLAQLAGNH